MVLLCLWVLIVRWFGGRYISVLFVSLGLCFVLLGDFLLVVSDCGFVNRLLRYVVLRWV